MDIQKVLANLAKKGYEPKYFETAREVGDYLVNSIKDTTVGIGGSYTMKQLGIYERLKAQNTAVYAHNLSGDEGDRKKATGADVYLLSANGIAETGEIVNIDGNGNRLSATLYGRDKVYIVVGINKFAADLDGAIWRARNVAAPKNAQRLGRKTPCALKGDRCYDCDSPQRICRAMTVNWRKHTGVKSIEVIIVNEELGF